MAGKVIFEEPSCHDSGYKIGIATLSNVSSLNALTYDMIENLYQQLIEWQSNPQIVCVVLNGAGAKAFCAGGDVRTMYKVMSEKNDDDIAQFCTEYFSLEYRCDHLIHKYKKPVIAWGSGFVMGGGMGLFMGASHRVVTPSSKLAMPEVSIGLYPDVGATWFLNQIDDGIGLFLGLTGMSVNASDSVDLGLADYLLLEEQFEELTTLLRTTHWPDNAHRHEIVSDTLSNLQIFAAESRPENQLMPFKMQIELACSHPDLYMIVQNIKAINCEEKWLDKAIANMVSGSPITEYICFLQMRRYNKLSLEESFQLELSMSVRCALLGEFKEGVRARLIDKDGMPNWKFDSIESVDRETIDTLITPLWTVDNHPLNGLGASL